MQGHGYYNAHSELQARSAQASDPVLDAALREVAIPAAGPITLADFGSSQGRNSLRPMGRALSILTARAGAEQDFAVIHTDQPHNDFASLFTLLQESEDSYLRERPNVFAYAIGRSFYGPLFPAGTLTFGWSSIALHWLSRRPAIAPNHLWFDRGPPEVREAFATVAAEDWLSFLTHRAKELAPGGQLVLVSGANDDEGQCGIEGVFDVANEVLQRMVAEGELPTAAYQAMTVPVRPRSRAEFEAPFRSGLLPELKLEEITIAPTPNPALDNWRADGNADALAQVMTGFFVGAFGPTLFGDDQPLENAFATHLHQAIAAQPERAARELVTGTVRVSRL
jgi:SAM dependent carboxyl methyltransferase